MSVWSRESDAHDRMDSLVRDYRIATEDRVILLERTIADTIKLLRDVERYGADLSAEECGLLAQGLEDVARGYTQGEP